MINPKLFIIVAICVGFFLAGRASVQGQPEINDFPSQCYTNLQSSRYFVTEGVSPISINNMAEEVKINFINEQKIRSAQIADTGSMRPTLGDHQEVLIIKPTREQLKIGDMILFQCPEISTAVISLHRIISIQQKNGQELFITKGDNNAVDDFIGFGCETHFEDIEAKVVGVLY
jgi:signal peptidase I